MKENPRDFNGAAKLFLVLAAFRMLMACIKNFQLISINNMIGYSSEMYTSQIVFSLLSIVAIVFTMMRKRWGLIALLVIALIEIFGTVPAGSLSYSYLLGQNVAEFVFNYGLFLIAMCFRKDGLSGWVAMLAAEEYVLAHQTKIEETFSESILVQDQSNITEE
jgi:hypothetical protein